LTEQTLIKTILHVLLLATSYLILVAMATYLYRDYAVGSTVGNSGGSSSCQKRVPSTIIIPVSLVILFGYIILLGYAYSYLSLLLAFLIFLVAILIYVARVLWHTRCRGKEQKVGDTICFICDTCVVGIWYSRGRIYVSRLLVERLTDDELKAIVQWAVHRIGIKNYTWLGFVFACLYALWLLILAWVSFMLLFFETRPLTLQQALTITISLYWLASVITLFTIAPSWVIEHELDKCFVKDTNLCIATMIAALVKVETYARLAREGLLEAIGGLQVQDIINNKEIVMKNLQFSSLFLTLLKHSLLYPKGIASYILNPTYPSSPPLRLRVAVLLHSLSRQSR